MAEAVVDKVTPSDRKHAGDVTSIILSGEVLFSAGSDGKIKVTARRSFEVFEAHC